jgi:ubiquinone biosynthesis accessory factor UbiJ
MQSNPFLAVHSAVQARAAQLACAVVNHLLKQEPTVQAHLKAHVGRTVLLRWDAMLLAPAGAQSFAINTDWTISPNSEAMIDADVTVSLQAGLLTAAADQRLRHIRIEGDALLAQDLSTVAQRLRWDAEHDLANIVGGTPAHWITRNARTAVDLFRQAVEQLKLNASDTLIHYPGWVLGAAALQAHQAELMALKTRIDALAARLAGAKR